MFQDDEDPFKDVSFSPQVAPSVNADEVNEVLKSFTPAGFTTFNTLQNAGADTKEGTKRVNQNTSQTGAVAYKDNKGQTVLTNVARDASTNKEAPILPVAPKLGEPGYTKKVDTALPLHNILQKLSTTDDSGAARGLFVSFQEAAAQEQVRLESEALAHAQVKLGIPALEKAVSMAEASNRASVGWYPGIGDAPNTIKARQELATARGEADKEAKRILGTNLSYKMLGNQIKQAEAEMNRIQRKLDRKDVLEDQNTLMSGRKKEEREEREKEQAEALTTNQMQRIQMLNGTDFVDEPDPRQRAFKIYKNMKDKNFHAAVDAPGDQIVFLALKGNKYAESILLAEEEKATGLPQAQVKAQVLAMQKAMDDPAFLLNHLKKRYKGDPKKAEGEVANLKAAMSGLDPNKKQEATDTKVRMALEAMVQYKTDVFLEDVSSWNSTDATLIAAMDKALKVTGKRGFDDVMVAYVGDSTGPEYFKKLADFQDLMTIAARKHKGSIFGMPDEAKAKALIAVRGVESDVFKRWMAARMAELGKLPIIAGGPNNESRQALASGAGGPFAVLLEGVDRGAFNAMGLFDKEKPAINPNTGLPFGE